jgi:hypothetical protein
MIPDCNDKAITCLVDSDQFNSDERSMDQMIYPSAISKNKGYIDNWCKLGAKLNSNGCTHKVPIGSSSYKRLCCNSSNDVNNCIK